ncbi:hypothetical protein KKF61_08460 [Patescibacteria group bacterium]|nr:hypothetical protein [Patescibacteria group bacterium]
MSNDSPQYKAIETLYDGYRFRSRTEARWAVFFKALGLRYEYETEGFDFGDGAFYLPDFWLPSLQLWIEIKGPEPSPGEKQKAHQLVTHTHHPALIISGQPGELPSFYGYQTIKEPPPYSILAFLPHNLCVDVAPLPSSMMRHPFLVVDEPLFDRLEELEIAIMHEVQKEPEWFTDEFLRTTPGGFMRFVAFECERFRQETGMAHPEWLYGIACPGLVWAMTGEGVLYTRKLNSKRGENDSRHWRLVDAYNKARGARFEYGQTPQF